MISVFDYKYTSMDIYTFMVCTDGVTTCMCLCLLFDVNSLMCYWVDVCIDAIFVCVAII